MTTIEDILRQTPYFADVSQSQLSAVARSAVERSYRRGDPVFLEGDSCEGLYVVKSGRVRVYKISPEGREQVLLVAGPGGTFNEVPVFDGSPNPVSAAAVEPSNVIVLSRETMLGILREYPDVAEAVVQVFASRLRHLVALVEDLSFRQVTARVARIVMQSVSPHEGVGAGVGGRVRITQREIAEMAGTSREVAARALKALEEAGAIDVRRGDIQIIDDARLSALA